MSKRNRPGPHGGAAIKVNRVHWLPSSDGGTGPGRERTRRRRREWDDRERWKRTWRENAEGGTTARKARIIF